MPKTRKGKTIYREKGTESKRRNQNTERPSGTPSGLGLVLRIGPGPMENVRENWGWWGRG